MKKFYSIFFIGMFIMPVFSESITKLVPLNMNEALDYFYNQDTYVLSIYKVQDNKKQIYYESSDALWGGYQISKDKKTIIFWKDNFESEMPLYCLDGQKGELRLLGDFPLNVRMDENGNYLMFEKGYKSGLFYIQELKSVKETTEIEWNISNKRKWIDRGATFSVLRAANNDDFDFMILFGIEKLSISKGFVKINSSVITTEYDDSNLDEVKLRKSDDYQSEFTGWY